MSFLGDINPGDSCDYTARSSFAERGRRWSCLPFAVLVVAAYFPGFSAAFIRGDDRYVSANSLIRGTASLWEVWTNPAKAPTFAPLTYSAFWAQSYGAAEPVGYHCVSVGLHLLVVGLLWTLLRRLSMPGASLAVAIFALHPIQAGTVGWIAQQGTMLSAACFLAALLCYLRWTGVTPSSDEWREPRVRLRLPQWPVLLLPSGMLLALAAMASNPAAVVWPLVATLIVEWKRGRPTPSEIGVVGSLGVVSVAVVAIFVAWTPSANAGRAVDMLADPPPSAVAWLAAAGPNTLLALAKLAAPIPVVQRIEWGGHSVPAWITLGTAGLLATAAVAAVGFRGRLGRATVFAVVTFIGCSVIGAALNRHDFGGEAAVDGGANYLPVAIPIALSAAAITRAADRWRAIGLGATRFAPAAVGFAVPLALAFLTLSTVPRYANAAAYWEARVSDRLGNGLAQRELGSVALADPATYGAAARHFESAAAARPDDVVATLGLSRAFEKLLRPDRAREALVEAIERAPREASYWAALARLEVSEGRTAAAKEHFAVALRHRSDDARIRNDYGLVLAGDGAVAEAVGHFRQAIAADVAFAGPRVNLATALFSLGRYEEAAGELREAVRIDPRNFEAYVNAGAMLMQFKQFKAAEAMFRSALAVRTDSPVVWQNLAASLAAQGRNAEAAWAGRRAEKLGNQN